MRSIYIEETYESRKFLRNSFLRTGIKTIKKWGMISAPIFTLIILILNFFEIADYLFVILISISVLLLTPLVVGFVHILFSPFMILPQQWNFNKDNVTCKGYRLSGTFKYTDIEKWNIFEIPELPGYFTLKLTLQGKVLFFRQKFYCEILIPPSISIADLKSFLNNSDNSKSGNILPIKPKRKKTMSGETEQG